MFARLQLPILLSVHLATIIVVGCGKQAGPPGSVSQHTVAELPDYGKLPAFSLIDQNSRNFTENDLRGHRAIIDFIFTRCAAVCPRLTQEMAAVGKLTASTPDVLLISISIDPEYDTVDKLAAYAQRYKADASRWRFLTGDKATIRALQVQTQRHLDPDEISAHSKQFYLVDGDGYIRGVYSMVQPDRRDEIMADLSRLMKSPSRPQPIPEL